MKNQYTKKQICEAIKYWKKRLAALNENVSHDANPEIAVYMERFREDCLDAGIDFGWFEQEGEYSPPMPKNEFVAEYEKDPTMTDDPESYEYGITPYDSAMHLFRRGCKFVGFVNDSTNKLQDFLLNDATCPKYVTASITRQGHEEQLQFGFGEHILPEDEVPMLHKYKVISLWYKPIRKTDIIEAEDEDDAKIKVEEMHAGSSKSRGDSDEIFDSAETALRI